MKMITRVAMAFAALVAFAGIVESVAPDRAEAGVCAHIFRGRSYVCQKKTSPPMNGSALAGPLINR